MFVGPGYNTASDIVLESGVSLLNASMNLTTLQGAGPNRTSNLSFLAEKAIAFSVPR